MVRFKAMLWLLAGLCLAPGLNAGADKIMKVLPHLVDLDGKHALSPSLFERDAYQEILRKNPKKCGGMQFDIRYKAGKTRERKLKVRLELVTPKHTKANPFVMAEAVKPAGWFGRWTQIKLDARQWKELGEIIAWRVSLMDGETLLSSENSFLW